MELHNKNQINFNKITLILSFIIYIHLIFPSDLNTINSYAIH
jgi:hypothetical protein